MVLNDRHGSAAKFRQNLLLQASTVVVRRYLHVLGWRSIRTKFCQYVTQKNRIERLVYAQTCLKFNENFDQTIFVDESTIQTSRSGGRTCFKVLPHENAFGLVGKFKSPIKVNVIGGDFKKWSN